MREQGRGRVVVVSADVGAGHDTAAAELSRRLREHGFLVDRVNLLDTFPAPVGWAFREAYRGILRWLPWGYQALFTVTSRSRAPVALVRALLRPVRRRMRRRIPPDTRVVVTTYPFANQLLGPMRRRLRVPVVTYVTDFVVHPTWVSPGVDVYCALRHAELRDVSDPVCLREVQPLVPAAFATPPTEDRARARDRFGLPRDGRLALIVAGAWGAGEVETTVAEVAGTGRVRPVVVCGRNETLRERLLRHHEHVFGWVDDMPALMRAVDLVVENAGGLTCQEALASGLPVVTYRPIPGHGRANASVLARHGLTRWVPAPEQLRPAFDALAAAFDDDPAPLGSAHRGPVAPPGRVSAGPTDPARLVAELAAAPPVAPAPAGRVRTLVTALADIVGDAMAVLVAVAQSAALTRIGRR
ncbi:MGDG synthase family glycosyltransferase [Micromonospora siamensis]|uniref:UDP-N-acetylglucosamine:LPS N-acetylglucosamine transferase n=1 Tax=Micromonospora siamensis TaxID=299152 RepID=A0A1C5ITS2_9ACTN|nr:glycosyltransferase [Micromonospora siamensis]SCG61401.1 UDP-N-acetylglucosamine:LPS N-acetylglucosamine transferase [Micromonospora siamensis]